MIKYKQVDVVVPVKHFKLLLKPQYEHFYMQKVKIPAIYKI